MKKIALDVEALRVASFATQAAPDWRGTVLANAVSEDVVICPDATKTLGCPITWSCPSTTP